jgi:hypothetical protein
LRVGPFIIVRRYTYLPVRRDDLGEIIDIGLMNDIIGDVPALPTRLEIFNHLVYRSDKQVGALENFVRRKLGLARQFLSRLAAVVRHDHTLHERVQFQALISLRPRSLAHKLHPLVNARYPPP